MAVYSLAYTAIPIAPTPPFPAGQTVYRPLLIAEVCIPGTPTLVKCFAWPDSGADHCTFPLSFATALGLNPSAMPMQMNGGVGNAANITYYETVEIKIPFTDGNVEPPRLVWRYRVSVANRPRRL